MKSTLAVLALLAVGASAAPTNGTTHELQARTQMRSKRGGAFNNVAQVAPMAGT
jgi:cytochrome c556